MKRLEMYMDSIKDELCSARDYAESYVYYKNMKPQWSKMYHDMAMQELQHASNLKEMGMEEYEELDSVYLSQEDKECWEKCIKKYTDKVAIVKVMLGM